MTTEPQRRSYRPGGWFGIFGTNATVLLPPSEKARVAGIWELIDDGAGFDEVLDALLATGLRDLPGFVLVSDTDDATKVVLRGPAVAAFVAEGAMIELAGSSDTTWVERSLSGVSQLFIQVEPTEEDADEDMVITTGLVRLARLEEPPYRPRGGARVDSSRAVDETPVAVDAPPEGDDEDEQPILAPGVAPDVDETADPLPAPLPQADDEPGAATASRHDLEDYAVEAPLEEPGSPEEHPDDESLPEEALDTEVLPTTPPIWQPAAPTTAMPEERPIWQAPPPPAPPFGAPGVPPGPPGYAPGPDGPTQAGPWTRQELGQPQPPVPPPGPQPPSAVARLHFSSGETVDVDRVVLVGRAPEPRRFAMTDQPRLVPVPSPHQEISSTHLEVRPGTGVDQGTAIVTDLGSTNGTVLVQPGLPPEDLTPGIAVQLLPGAIIDLGDGVTIQVTSP
ncbi:MAG: FHA domain-containing protein [Nocardioidaceae bacterium]